ALEADRAEEGGPGEVERMDERRPGEVHPGRKGEPGPSCQPRPVLHPIEAGQMLYEERLVLARVDEPGERKPVAVRDLRRGVAERRTGLRHEPPSAGPDESRATERDGRFEWPLKTPERAPRGRSNRPPRSILARGGGAGQGVNLDRRGLTILLSPVRMSGRSI